MFQTFSNKYQTYFIKCNWQSYECSRHKHALPHSPPGHRSGWKPARPTQKSTGNPKIQPQFPNSYRKNHNYQNVQILKCFNSFTQFSFFGCKLMHPTEKSTRNPKILPKTPQPDQTHLNSLISAYGKTHFWKFEKGFVNFTNRKFREYVFHEHRFDRKLHRNTSF